MFDGNVQKNNNIKCKQLYKILLRALNIAF